MSTQPASQDGRRTHSRQVSSDDRRMRVAMPRRSTRGPLDILDEPQPETPAVTSPSALRPPISALQTNLPPSPGPIATTTTSPSTLLSPTSPAGTRSRTPSPNRLRIDLTPLLRPIYASLPTTTIAPAFLNSPNQPAPNTPLQTLLTQGHFRPAAALAAQTLTTTNLSPYDSSQILSLYHTRLATLLLSNNPDLAAKESRYLLDILAREGVLHNAPNSRASSRERPAPETSTSLIPWDLRLLLQRLGTADARRGIMGLYGLGSECRAQATLASKTGNMDAYTLWRTRLADIGIRVAGALIEMGELEAAARCLDGLEDDKDGDMEIRKALLYLRIGDLERARSYLSSTASASSQAKVLAAMLEPEVLSLPPDSEDVLATHNSALSLLYSGQILQSLEVLEGLVEKGQRFPGLLTNLATVYELCSEKSREKKGELVEKVAGMAPEGENGAWERGVGVFKL